jgi:nicotinamidase-related amidase
MKTEWLDRPALILIDIQKGFDNLEYFGGERNNYVAEHNAGRLLEYWRKRNWPLFHIKHCSVIPGSPLSVNHSGNDIKDEVKPLPGEPVIHKKVNSAFIGTDLKARLDAEGIRTVVIAGLITQYCVSTTARMAGNYGYHTIVIADATAAFRQEGLNGESLSPALIHEVSLATIKGEFAEVISIGELFSNFVTEIEHR